MKKEASALEVLVEPIDGQTLSFLAFFSVYAVVLDAFENSQFLDSLGPFMGEDGMVRVVEEFLVFRYDEKFGASLDAIDVLNRRVAHKLLQHGNAGEVAELGAWLRVIQFAAGTSSALAKGLSPHGGIVDRPA